jgi:hypothetical protein
MARMFHVKLLVPDDAEMVAVTKDGCIRGAFDSCSRHSRIKGAESRRVVLSLAGTIPLDAWDVPPMIRFTRKGCALSSRATGGSTPGGDDLVASGAVERGAARVITAPRRCTEEGTERLPGP